VFAVLGLFVDPTGQGPLCITREHDTIHIGHQLEQAWIDESPPGLLLTPDATKEGNAAVLVKLLIHNGALTHQEVALLADQSSAERANDTILPALRAKKVATGSTGELSITGSDTTAAQAQLDSFIEKWKADDVTAVLLVGSNVTAKQFVEPIRAAMPKVMLLSDSASGCWRRPRTRPRRAPSPTRTKGCWCLRQVGFGAVGGARHALSDVHRHLRARHRADGPRPDAPVRNAAGKRSTSTHRSPTSAASSTCSAPSPSASVPTSRLRTGRRR